MFPYLPPPRAYPYPYLYPYPYYAQGRGTMVDSPVRTPPVPREQYVCGYSSPPRPPSHPMSPPPLRAAAYPSCSTQGRETMVGSTNMRAVVPSSDQYASGNFPLPRLPQQPMSPPPSPPPPRDREMRIVTPPSKKVIVKEEEEDDDRTNTNGRVLLTYYQLKSSNRRSPREVIRISDGDCSSKIFKLKRGGCLKIYPNLVDVDQCNRVKDELLQSPKFFRVYQIQGNEEPRAHFLLHEDATDDFEGASQPGYRYNGFSTTLKSRPLSTFKEVQKLSEEMKEFCKVDKWTIGVNPVIYRGSGDKMGDHADDDQGEEVILAVVIDSPESPIRRIHIKPKGKLDNRKDGDEDIELFLRPGDAYEMDGKMQQFYSHAIPRIATEKTKKLKKEEVIKKEEDRNVVVNDIEAANSQRIVIVFRTGECVYFKRDSGKACLDLSPPVKQRYAFGTLDWLQEGELYSRTELYTRGGHLAQQRGLSGNKEIGCDAIIVSGLRDDGLGVDWLTRLMYAVERCKGAQSVVTSMKNEKPIRIFRSTRYRHYCGAKPPGHIRQPVNSMQQLYRYDGLYFVYDYTEPQNTKHPYLFYLERFDGSPNKISNASLRLHCEKMGTMLGFDYQYVNHKGDIKAKRECDHSYVAQVLLEDKVKRQRSQNDTLG